MEIAVGIELFNKVAMLAHIPFISFYLTKMLLEMDKKSTTRK